MRDPGSVSIYVQLGFCEEVECGWPHQQEETLLPFY